MSTEAVVLIDADPKLSTGLEVLLTSSGSLRVVGPTRGGAAPEPPASREAPDLAVVDLTKPPPGGLEALRRLKAQFPALRVLALSDTEDAAEALRALRAGAEGLLPATSGPTDLVAPLFAMAGGWSVLPGDVLRRLADGRHGSTGLPTDLDHTETTLLCLLADGLGCDEIAARLFVSERTVKRMTAALLRRLGVENRAQAAALAGRSGLLG